MALSSRLIMIYDILLARFGPQGWWPILDFEKHKGLDPLTDCGYHPGNYDLPKKPDQMFQVIVGAILTQNTNWQNVVKALFNLSQQKLLDPEIILKTEAKVIAEAIRPSGYYNEKAKKLRIISQAYLEQDWYKKNHVLKREDLLKLWGVGEETADSILLYVFKRPFFVIDAYTRRLLMRMGIVGTPLKYREYQDLFHSNLRPNFELFNEYHALIVRLAKSNCRNKPICSTCPLKRYCPPRH